ncbi:hypothetical protein Hypma_012830 [Hypsizygus marmoreus]|uniref:Uncharacterized protein n=1 Tax=Hypsizygus marmoreus TaxID=39966 RepID=A0A369JCJ6_HYPMA|nr:hypothetical protein Hypma_012830 [Hypsizygus marmoreus]
MPPSSSRSRSYNDGGYRLSGRDMLSYGFKYGDPWSEDRRALERAFREMDMQSASSADSGWSPQSSHVDAGSTLSTLSSRGSATTARYSGYYDSRNYGYGDRRGDDSWQSQAVSRGSGGGSDGMEVVRLGDGGDRARYSGPSSGRTSAAMTYAGRNHSRIEASESGRAADPSYTGQYGGDLMQRRYAAGSPRWGAGSQSPRDPWWDRSYSQGTGSEYDHGLGPEDASYHGSSEHERYYSGTLSTVSSGWDDDESELGWASSDSDEYSHAASGYVESQFEGESEDSYSGDDVVSEESDDSYDYDEYSD